MAVLQETNNLYKRYIKNISQLYEKRQDVRIYTELLLSITVIIIFGIFAIRPTLVTIAGLNTEIQEKRDINQKLAQKIRDLDQAQNLVNSNKGNLILLEAAVPDGPLPTVFTRQIEGLARQNNTNLISLETSNVGILGTATNKSNKRTTTKEDTKSDRYPTSASSMEYSFEIQGSYEDLTELISNIENLRRPIFIDVLSIRAGKEGQEGELILSVVGRVPYLSNEK